MNINPCWNCNVSNIEVCICHRELPEESYCTEIMYAVECLECGETSDEFLTEEEAIEQWNRMYNHEQSKRHL